jgi:hypothetical protein
VGTLGQAEQLLAQLRRARVAHDGGEHFQSEALLAFCGLRSS